MKRYGGWVFGCAMIVACEQSPPTPAASHEPQASASTPLVVPRRSRDLRAQVAAIDGFVADEEVPNTADGEIVDILFALGERHRTAPLPAEAKSALFRLFERLRAHTPKAKNRGLSRTLKYVLVDVADPAWEPALLSMLAAPLVARTRAQRKPWMDQAYWQTTAAEILGRLHSNNAIEPLLAIVLSPTKQEIAPVALTALTRIGEPVVAHAQRWIDGSDPKLMPSVAPQVRGAITVLGALGTTAARGPLLSATRSKTKSVRQLAAAELAGVPFDATVLAAFKRVYAETAPAEQFPNGEHFVKQRLLATAPNFFDVTLAKWILDDLQTVPRSHAQRTAIASSALGYAFVAADRAAWPAVEEVYAEVDGAPGDRRDGLRLRTEYTAAKTLLEACEDDVDCHAQQLARTRDPNDMPAARAVHMWLALSETTDGTKLLQRALTTSNNRARELLAAALLHTHPAGDVQLATAIEAAYAEARKQRDEPLIARIRPLVATAAVLRARAHQ